MKFAGYCRISTDKEEQLDSLEHQREFFETYAKQNNHELYRLYADEGITGTSLKKRTEFNRLMRDAEFGLFDAVIVKDISRFARNTVDFLQSIRRLKTMGVNTIFLTANMTSLGDSEFILTIFGAMAQEESANLSKRVKWGKKINAKKGRVPQRIFGYERVDNYTLQIIPEEAEIIRHIYDLYNNHGLGCRRISIVLNQEQVKTKFGCEWNPCGVKRVLHNSIYCGEYVNNKYEIEDFLTGHQVHIPKEEHMHHDRPEWAIVSKEEYEKAQKNIAMRRKQYESYDPSTGCKFHGRYSNKHTFSTIIKCSECGRSFARMHYTYVNTRIYWTCPTNANCTAKTCSNGITITEGDLIEQIKSYLSSCIEDKGKFISRIVDTMMREEQKTPLSGLNEKAIRNQIDKLLKKKDKFQELYANDLIDIDELKPKITAINKELLELKDGLDNALVVQKKEERAASVAEQYREEIQRFLSLESLTNEDVRKVIENIIAEPNGTVTINLKKL